MGKEATLPERLGVTPGKMVLIGVLAVMLVGVIYYQYGQYSSSGSDEGAAGVAAAPDRGPRGGRQSAQAATKRPIEEQSGMQTAIAPDDPVPQKLWEAPELASVIQYDPFALPASFPQSARTLASGDGVGVSGAAGTDGEVSRLASLVEELQMQLEELRQRGVTVIVKHRDEYAAMIGDRTVHVGDEINGFTVTAIEPGGVQVERKIQE